MTSLISKKTSKISVKKVLEKINEIVTVENFDLQNEIESTVVLLNGCIIGYTKTPEKTVFAIIDLRRKEILNYEVSVSFDFIDKEIRIFCDEGRLLRPLIRLENNKMILKPCNHYNWNDLIKKSYIEYLDPSEIEFKVIAMTQKDLEIQKNDYCEIHPFVMLGVMAGCIPFSDHSQSPRNCYQSSMGKQALGIPLQSYNVRTDTNLYILHYPQKPLVATRLSKYIKQNEMPSGINAIVAIAALSGYNQEDSCILNKAAVERGLFSITSYYTIEYTEKKRDAYSYEEICLPPLSTVGIKEDNVAFFKRKNANYSLLDENGIVKPRQIKGENGKNYEEATFVRKGDVIIGKVINSGNKNGEYHKTDESVIIHLDQEGTIDRVHVSINPNGYKVIKIVIREWRLPTLGDKFAARSSQKATVGAIIPEIDMPRTASGIVPDIIINPCCIPGRMTINQLIECVLGKECLETSTFADATPFTEFSTNVADKLVDRLKNYGFDSYGWETMYCGITGERFQSKIFMGPTYYQRLKHMVFDKIHARARGSVTVLTRQPLEGRSRDGGLRMGEMERDALVAHGASAVINERLYKVSDPFRIPICKKCEIIVSKETNCQSCNENNIKWVTIPYASKLLFSELNNLLLKIGIS